MNDNIIPFRRRKPSKQSRETPPWLRRLWIIIAVVAVLLALFFYFYLTGPSAGSM